MHARERLARNLAASLLAGTWTRRALRRRAEAILGRRTKLVQQSLIDALIAADAEDYPPSPEWLVAFFLTSPEFERAGRSLIRDSRRIPIVLTPPKFAPAKRFAELTVPRLATPSELARWLEMSTDEVDWFSDARRQHARTDIPILQHYRYAFVAKKHGPPRLLEIPKPKLMAIQRRILCEMLARLPTHDCAYGFVRGRSCVSAAQIHAGETIVVTLDLTNFFLNTQLSRVHGIFRSLGYPWAVARILTGLCSSATPKSVFMRLPPAHRHDWLTQKTYQTTHLPQGAPTSPTLANLAAWHLDARLLGLAKSFGATYTRYADDMAFSGDQVFAQRLRSFLAVADHVVRDEGFTINASKTRIMRRGGRQRITGIVVNDHVNVPRTTFDALKATLHNCIRNGPAAENRAALRDFRSHLDGKVTWVENVNPNRGRRLRKMFNEITW